MKGILKLGALAAALALFAALTGVAAASQSAGRGVTLSVAKANFGRVLADGRGRTLYLFQKDTPRKSFCAGPCAQSWLPLIATGKTVVRAGARSSLLGTIKRADGRLQVTYNRHPLYTFAADMTKGQANGEGLDSFGGEWYAIAPGGTKIETSQDQSGADGQSSGGYGYGY
jgi:predicted lipoprotein with Yx(FWY)xxD motif